MRLLRGKLTRTLPRATPTPMDLIVRMTWCGGPGLDEHYVCAATDQGDFTSRPQRIGPIYGTRSEAVAAAWRLLESNPTGRLLDYQRSTLAEQPFLFSLRFVRRPDPEEWATFARGKPGERKLIRALECWTDLPTKDARTWARLLVAKGEAEYPLTQTEIRHTYAPRPMKPAVAEVWEMVELGPAQILPYALERRS